jgi:hypothetical protein
LPSALVLVSSREDWQSATDDAQYVLSQYRVPTITKIPALAVLGHLLVRRGDPDAKRLLNEAHDLAIQTGELQRLRLSLRHEQSLLG